MRTNTCMSGILITMAMLIGMGLGAVAGPAAAAPADIVVFAAASTTDAINEIGELYAAGDMGRITTSFASSSTLAKQIVNGAPADVFVSADKQWMDYLEEKNAIDKAGRFDLLGNRIVLIAPKQSPIKTVAIRSGLALAPMLGSDGRLSMADPEHVPVGIYGKKALESLGLWEQVEDRLAPMKDVRAALVLVERGEAPLGVVYATDAAISKNVRLLGTFPLNSHPPIVYPVAAVSGGKSDAAGAFMEFLKTSQAREVFEKYGFEVR